MEHFHGFGANGDFGKNPESIGWKDIARRNLYAHGYIWEDNAGLWLHRQGRTVQPPHHP